MTRHKSTAFIYLLLFLGSYSFSTNAAQDFAFSDALANGSPGGSKLIELVQSGERLFAAGERGLIAYSDDGGENWTQAAVPVSSTLTGMSFSPNGTGFAVGHGGVILRAPPGGENWEKVFDGYQANTQFLEWAKANRDRREKELAALTATGDADRGVIEDAEYALEDAVFALEDAEVAVETGPADPLLAVLFIDDNIGVAAGAYGMVYRTGDGGNSWQLAIDGVDNPERFHFYSLALDANGRLHASGEAGLLFYSNDAGETWTRAYDVYDGSLFALVSDNGSLYAIGLRGNVFRSTDGGESWLNVPLEGSGSLYAGVGTAGGRLILVGTGGRVVYSDDGGQSFVESIHPSRAALSDVVVAGDRLLFASMAGFLAESLENYRGD